MNTQQNTVNMQQLNTEWTFELLEYFDLQIQQIADEYKLDIYSNQIEIITAAQMLESCSNAGMPINYNHWSYGKHYVNLENKYKQGMIGLAYELVINADPCIAYLMEENTLALQVTIMAHACYGHNSFFKNNYLFKTWTQADSIIDFFAYAKSYIAQCEEQYGVAKVEEILDSCHALRNCGLDTYKRPFEPDKATSNHEQNLLFFLEKNSSILEPWEREIIKIVRTINQYFYPQQLTKVMNEGWATFWHYTIINTMYERNLVNDSFMLEFLHLHTEVINQPKFDEPGFSGLNPYALGFKIFQDIRRICENPTAEDEIWFPDLVNTPWLNSLDFAMRNFKDETFITQYLSPKVIRDLRLFALTNSKDKPYLEVTHIHDQQGYKKIRELLAQQYNFAMLEPYIQVLHVATATDQTLTIQHTQHRNVSLDSIESIKVLQYLHRLWGFNVRLEETDAQGTHINSITYPMDSSHPAQEQR